jgi:hypothetical protein
MDDRASQALIDASHDKIDRYLPEMDIAEVFHDLMPDDAGLLTLIVPTEGSQPRRLLASTYDEEGDIEHTWDQEIAMYSFMRYMLGYASWMNPTHGAVSPALSEFFAWCDDQVPGLVHWARWLRIPHESDTEIYYYDPELAAVVVEAMIAEIYPEEADLMRRAVRGEPVGERDPDQLTLFSS